MDTETTGVKPDPADPKLRQMRHDDSLPKRRRIALPSLRLRTSERRLLLLLMDLLLLNGSLAVAWILGSGYSPNLLETLTPWKWYLTLSVVWCLWALFFDLYNLARAASTFNTVRGTSPAVVLTVLTYIFIPNVTPPLQSRSLVFLFLGLALTLVVAWRVAYAQLFVQPRFKQRALVVGAGWAGRTLVQAMRTASDDANPFRGTGYQVLGFIDDDPALAGGEVAGLPVLGGHYDLVSLARALEVEEIILAITHRHAIADELFEALLRCRELGERITTMSSIYELLLGRVPVEHVGGDLALALSLNESASERLYWVFKRLLDLASALVGLALMALLAPVVALANSLTSRGPLLYRQTRVGRGGRRYQCLKFRSMIPEAEQETGAVWARERDDRITPAGRVLRRTRLDELPQFVNVLRGEMSLIGPRPERPEFVAALAREIPFYRARHAVRPGITGWAQTQYRYGSSIEDARIKLEHDLYYVKNASVLLDVRIMVQTAAVMLRLGGR